MVKLKSFYRIGVAPDVMFLMSEKLVHRLELKYLELINKLATGMTAEQIELSTDEELEQLRTLNRLGVIHNSQAAVDPLLAYIDISGVNEAFSREQIKHARVKIVNHHRCLFYADQIKTDLVELGIKVVDSDESITVNVVERLNQLSDTAMPALHVKMGSYRPSIGPLINPTFTAAELSKKTIETKSFFETEAFLADLPAPLQRLSCSLISTEILWFLIRAGRYEGIFNIVEWDLTNMRRIVWK